MNILLGLSLGIFLGNLSRILLCRLSGNIPLARDGQTSVTTGYPEWIEYIPVVRALKGLNSKSRSVSRILSQIFYFEFLGGLISAAWIFNFGLSVSSIGYLVFVFSLLIVSVVDLRAGLVPDVITLPCVFIGVLSSPWVSGNDLPSAIVGSASAAGLLFLLSWTYERLRGRKGMGLGDIKLAAALGAFLGLHGAVTAICLGAITALVFYGVLCLGRRISWHGPLPFAPFLAAGSILAISLREQLSVLAGLLA